MHTYITITSEIWKYICVTLRNEIIDFSLINLIQKKLKFEFSTSLFYVFYLFIVYGYWPVCNLCSMCLLNPVWVSHCPVPVCLHCIYWTRQRIPLESNKCFFTEITTSFIRGEVILLTQKHSVLQTSFICILFLIYLVDICCIGCFQSVSCFQQMITNMYVNTYIHTHTLLWVRGMKEYIS